MQSLLRSLLVCWAAAWAAGCAGNGVIGGDRAPLLRSREAPRLDPAPERGEPAGALTEQEAVALALRGNPGLASCGWELRAADARAEQAAALPDPVAGIELEEFGGDRHGLREVEATAVLGQELELGGKRALRMEAAGRGRDAAGWEYEAERRKVRRAASLAFTRVLAAQRRLEFAGEGLTIAAEVRDTIAKAVEAGAAAAVEEAGARMACAAARSEQFAAAEGLGIARAALAALWGGAEARFTRAEGELLVDVAPEPIEKLRARLDRHPELRRAEAEVGMRESLHSLESARRIPNVTVRAGYRRLEGENAGTFVAGIELPLPVFDTSRGRIREAEARLAGAERLRAARERELGAALARAHAALRIGIERRDAFRKEILPCAEAAFDAARRSYAERLQGYRDLLAAEEKLLEVRRDYIGVLAEVREAWAEIEYLTGAAESPLAAETVDR